MSNPAVLNIILILYDYFVKLVHNTSTKSQFATKRAKNPKLSREISQKSFKRYPANVIQLDVVRPFGSFGQAQLVTPRPPGATRAVL